MSSIGRLAATIFVGLVVIGVTTLTLFLNEPAKVTSSYEVLEPETWIGKPLPIIDSIDIADRLQTGRCLVLFYSHSCGDCEKAIAELEDIADILAEDADLLRIALIEVPPYGQKRLIKMHIMFFHILIQKLPTPAY